MSSEATLIPETMEEKELIFTTLKGRGQLSSQHNKGDELRHKITHHHNIRGQRVYAGVHKVHWGTYNSNPACLLVIRFRFYYDKGLFRLRKAAITITFNTHPPHRAVPEDTRPDPILRVYSPKHVWGAPTEEERETHWEIAARIAVTAGPVEIALPELSRGGSSRVKVEHAVEIAGMDEPEYDKEFPNKLTFEIDENDKIARGVPKELFFGMVVENEGAMQAQVATSIGDATAWPWSRDDPIILKPGETFGALSASLSEKFELWSDDDWNSIVPYIEETGNVKQGQTS